MVKKVLLTITAGIVAVSMCACASSTAILEEAQGIISENVNEIESYLPEEVAGLFIPDSNTASESAEEITQPAEQDAAVAQVPEAEEELVEEAVPEEAAAEPAEEAVSEEAVPEEAVPEEAITEPEAVAPAPEEAAAISEETAAAPEEAVVEPAEIAEEATEASAETETKVMLNDAEEATEAAAETETKVMLNDAEEATEAAAETETKVMMGAVEETTAAADAAEEATAAAEEETTAADDAEEATAAAEEETTVAENAAETETAVSGALAEAADENEISIKMEDGKVSVDGKELALSASGPVSISKDLYYYQDKDTYTSGNPYGAGTNADKHTAKEAEEYSVIKITEAGTYRLAGSWKGQIRVDLGKDARNNKDAKVVLILDDADIVCKIAPAVVFENVYECDTKTFAEAYAAEEYVEQMTGAAEKEAADKEDAFAVPDSDAKEEADSGSIGDADNKDNTGNANGITDPSAKDDADSKTDANTSDDEGSKDDASVPDLSFFYDDSYDELTDEQREQLEMLFNLLFTDPSAYEEMNSGTDDGKIDADSYAEFFGYGTNDDTTDSNPYDSYFNSDDTDDTADTGNYDSFFGSEKEEETTGADADDSFFGSKDDEEKVEEVVVKNDLPTDLNTADAGAVIRIAKGSENLINGSHVACIYKDSKEKQPLLEEEGAITSYVSLNVEAETGEEGVLNIIADKAGVNSKHHLTVNGGKINITAGSDGMDACEKGVSVLSVNNGTLHIWSGVKEEGCFLCSDGWIAINNGSIVAATDRQDDNIPDCKVLINGGNVFAAGFAEEKISDDSKSVAMGIQFDKAQSLKDGVRITDQSGKEICKMDAAKDELLAELSDHTYVRLLISSPELKKNESYYVYLGDDQLTNSGTKKAEEEPALIPADEKEEETTVADSIFGKDEKEETTAADSIFDKDEKEETTVADSIFGKDEKEEETTTAGNTLFGKDDSEDDSTMTQAEVDAALEELEEYKDVFEFFGISMEDLEDYYMDQMEGGTTANVKDDDQSDAGKDDAGSIFDNKDAGDKDAADTADEAEKDTKEFLLKDTFTVFIGVKAEANTADAKAEEETTAADSAEEETTVTEPAEEETTAEAPDAFGKEDADASDSSEKEDSATEEKETLSPAETETTVSDPSYGTEKENTGLDEGDEDGVDDPNKPFNFYKTPRKSRLGYFGNTISASDLKDAVLPQLDEFNEMATYYEMIRSRR